MSRIMGIFGILAAVTIGLSAVPANAPEPERAPLLVPYKTLADGTVLNLHVFEPDGEAPKDGRPAIVFFFGGGWVNGSPSQFYPQCRHLVERGFIAMAAEYRIKSKHNSTVPQSVADGKSAIRYVRAHAKELGINPDKIIAGGGSAGGHVAACTGTLPDYDEAGEDMSISSIPNAMILMNPVIDTTPAGYTGKMLPTEGDRSLSPVHHVTKDTPPTLICHGTADPTVPYENVVRFKKVMADAGSRCVLDSYEGAKHGFFNPGREDGKYYPKTLAAIDAFIDSLEW